MAGLLTDVIWPFELHGHVSIAVVVGFYPFYDGEGSKILYEYDGGRVGEGKGVIHAC